MNNLTAYLRAAVAGGTPHRTVDELVADTPAEWTRNRLAHDVEYLVDRAKTRTGQPDIAEHFHWLVAGYEEDDPTCEWWTEVLAPTAEDAYWAVGANRYGDIGCGRRATSATKADSFMNQTADLID